MCKAEARQTEITRDGERPREDNVVALVEVDDTEWNRDTPYQTQSKVHDPYLAYSRRTRR